MTNVPEPSIELFARARAVRLATVDLVQTNNGQRVRALQLMGNALAERSASIVAANQEDLDRSAAEGLSPAFMARLKLDEKKLASAIDGIQKVVTLPDPLGRRQLHRELDDGLVLERVTVPLGVVGVIFEARPDAVVQIASLAIRSGNGALLKGGNEARCTNKVVMNALKAGLDASEISSDTLTLLTTRRESLALLRLNGLVDLIIPRGSNKFIRFIQDNTRIPILGHADGICHLYVDAAANIEKAIRVAVDSKTQYPAACNAIETLLVHHDIASAFLSDAVPAFQAAGVTLRGDAASQAFGISESASEEDWDTEYLDLTLAVRIVGDFAEATEHIRRYGSRHTEVILTEDLIVAERFFATVDSAGVYHNCSSRFADGFRYGFGAEIGISTQTLPPRGPVGLEGLVTYRYQLRGDGHVAADYANGDRSFTHNDLPL
ncbi:glutamate-5-semialdehyde dehydrogenase [Synechococcus sp. M16CYN]|uniref:glutamate-5-semialdehyde dehydrogenase n=1 Tax=Synechococcus sp. M16CYN TaxID=3103139 RepID=UPI003255264A